LLAEAPGQIFGQRVAVALPVGGAHEGCDDVEVPVLDLAGLAPEIGEAKVDIELQQVDAARALRHGKSLEGKSDDIGAPLALAAWERSISGRPECPLARAPKRRSSYYRSAAIPPARSTSRAASGWTIRGRSASAASLARPGSRAWDSRGRLRDRGPLRLGQARARLRPPARDE